MISMLGQFFATRLWWQHDNRLALAALLANNVALTWRKTAIEGFRVSPLLWLVAVTWMLLRRPSVRIRLALAVALHALDRGETYWLRQRKTDRGTRARLVAKTEASVWKRQVELVIDRATALLYMPVVLYEILRAREWAKLHPSEINQAFRQAARPGAFMTPEERDANADALIDELEDAMGMMGDLVQRRRAERPSSPPEAPRPPNHGTKSGDAVLDALRSVADDEGLPPAGE